MCDLAGACRGDVEKKTLAINLMKNRFTKIEHLVWADIWYLRKAPPPRRFPTPLSFPVQFVLDCLLTAIAFCFAFGYVLSVFCARFNWLLFSFKSTCKAQAKHGQIALPYLIFSGLLSQDSATPFVCSQSPYKVRAKQR